MLDDGLVPLNQDDERDVKATRKGQPFLLSESVDVVSKFVRGRWNRLDEVMRRRQVELKVNFLRFKGDPFVQVHPEDPNRTWSLAGSRQRSLPTFNKLERAVHRYVAQVTADEPVIEAAPASHAESDREAADASTQVLSSGTRTLKACERRKNFSVTLRPVIGISRTWTSRARK
jgi:hypothetical protein